MLAIKSNLMMAGMLMLASSTASLAQDAFGYTATSPAPYSYINIAATGAGVLAGTDDGTATLTLPFPFRFYGTSYTSLCASSNGLIAFGGCPVNDFNNLDLTAQSPPGNLPLIAPFWTDLTFGVPGAGSLLYQTLGAAGSRQFVLQWNNVLGQNAPGALNFQVVLTESANTIVFQYQNAECTDPAISKGAGATVGIRGANGHVNNYRLQWSYRAPVLANNLAIRFTPPSAAGPLDVSASVKATTSAFVYNRLKQTYSGTITITNISAAPLARPLTILLTNLTPGVTMLNATGTLPGQGPYYVMPGTGPLNPGQSAAVSTLFSNPSNTKVSFVVKTYSGSF